MVRPLAVRKSSLTPKLNKIAKRSASDRGSRRAEHDDAVKDGRRTMEQFVADLTTRLVKDGVTKEGPHTLVEYHCSTCNMQELVSTFEGVGSSVHWHPLLP